MPLAGTVSQLVFEQIGSAGLILRKLRVVRETELISMRSVQRFATELNP